MRSLAVLLLGSIVVSGCNAGVAGLLFGLLSDKDDGGRKKREVNSEPPAVGVEFLGLENARTRPASAVIRLRLQSPAADPLDLLVEVSIDGGPLRPVTLVAPLPGAQGSTPGTLQGILVAEEGSLVAIGWNALADFQSDALQRAKLHVTAFRRDALPRSVSADVLVGNDAPRITNVLSHQEEGEDVSLDLVISDSSSDPVDLALEFATEPPPGAGREFRPATISGETRALTTAPDGGPHALSWQATLDAGPFDRPLVIRLTPLDRIDGEAGKVGDPVEHSLILDGNRSAEVEILKEEFLTDPDQRRGLTLRFRVRDMEMNPVDALIQWTAGDAPFPPLDPALDSDPDARRALLANEGSRRQLQLASALPDWIEGTVERPLLGGSLAPAEILATWIKAECELRGIAGDRRLAGRQVEVLSPGGGVPRLGRVCGYSPESGLLELDAALDPPAVEGSILRIDLGGPEGPLLLSSSEAGVAHSLAWDGGTELPGGGAVRFRITPFDVVAGARAGCGSVPGPSEPGIGTGARGRAEEIGGAKRIRGPFAAEPASIVPLFPVDSPFALVAADVDQDGRMDLVCAARFSSSIIVLLQTAPGVFDQLRIADSRFSAPSGLVAQDLDGDGDIDIAAPDEEGGRILIVLQKPGLDFFTERVILSANGTLMRPRGIAASDFDGDGDIDLAVTEAGGEERGVKLFFRGTAPGGAACGAPENGYVACFLKDPDRGEPHAIAAASITSEGAPDLVTGGQGFFGVYSLSVAGGALSFNYTRIETPGSDLRSVAVADLDRNGRADLVAADAAGHAVRIASQTDAMIFQVLAPVVAASLGGPLALAEADLDHDGTIDLVLADPGDPASGLGGSVWVFLGGRAGTYSFDRLERSSSRSHEPPSPSALVVADIDGDGSLDIASADEGPREIAIYRQRSRGTFREPAVLLAPTQRLPPSSSLAAADLNGDGRTDLIVPSSATDELALLEQQGGGSFAAFSLALPPPDEGSGASRRGPNAAAAGDLNGDGRCDIVTANVVSNDLSVLLGDGDGGYSATSVQAEGFRGPHSIALADLDGDGRLDVVAAARFSGEARWFRQGEDGKFLEAQVFRPQEGSGIVMAGPISIAVQDIDRDGRADVITANQQSGNLTVFLQTEARGTFASPLELKLEAGLRPVAVAAADLEGDGDMDIVTATLGTSAAGIFSMADGGTTVLSTLPGAPDVQPTALALRDLDGDGRRDLAIAFSGNGGSFLRVSFQGTGGAFGEASSRRLEFSALVAPIGLAAIDLDGDGEADLAAAGRLSRTVEVFYGGR